MDRVAQEFANALEGIGARVLISECDIEKHDGAARVAMIFNRLLAAGVPVYVKAGKPEMFREIMVECGELCGTYSPKDRAMEYTWIL